MFTTSHLNLTQATKVDLFTISGTKYHIRQWAEHRDRILDMIPNQNDFDNHIKFTDYMEEPSSNYKEDVEKINGSGKLQVKSNSPASVIELGVERLDVVSFFFGTLDNLKPYLKPN